MALHAVTWNYQQGHFGSSNYFSRTLFPVSYLTMPLIRFQNVANKIKRARLILQWNRFACISLVPVLTYVESNLQRRHRAFSGNVVWIKR